MPDDEYMKQRGLDWGAAYRRLARLATATEASLVSDPEQEQAVLDERARQLSRTATPTAAPGHLLELILFHVDEQDYALETRFVREVLRSSEQRVLLPGAPPQLRGVTLLHGEVLAVVELAPLFGRPAPTQHGPVLVLGPSRAELGLRVDHVREVLSLTRDSFLPPPAALSGQDRTLVSGITREGIIVLEGEALLGDGRLFFDLSEERVT
ncbi:putative chemotaxis protein CheW [Cystobacter fuscus DSM 2262]|uniref:Chemotaxis protein CheW n=1 Tax=Cystobacter fuscus (strain ATCC 25194 / DSM 2262 / NBRC 100088 / M29) TaxID=1242864 RepID=S9NVT4_CYSF2|nr:chemotaxis protein CheW [Cystobacter fuscus]EPX55026.1 putative chemotaxis protein CheW [Cystobacter fuscus DSM 2262]